MIQKSLFFRVNQNLLDLVEGSILIELFSLQGIDGFHALNIRTMCAVKTVDELTSTVMIIG